MLIFFLLLAGLVLSVVALYPVRGDSAFAIRSATSAGIDQNQKARAPLHFRARARRRLRALSFKYDSKSASRDIRESDSSKAVVDIAANLKQHGSSVLEGLRFGVESSRLHGLQSKALSQLADFIQAHPGQSILIEGHSDQYGSVFARQQLSVRRAESVRDRLASQYNLDPAKIIVSGMGSSRPIADDSLEGRRLNRRVEVHLIDTKPA